MTRGFTLIELLVVVAILSAVTMASFSLVTDGRMATARSDDTLARLSSLRRATVGLEAPAWDGAVRLSGYVADNGVLPENVAALLSRPTGLFKEQAGVVPIFSSMVDAECVQTGTNTSIAEAELLKGHRGNYLAGLAHNGVFRDGWGNVSQVDDGANFGWQVTKPYTDALSFASLGIDNLLPVDQQTNLAADDWQVDLNGWEVTLKWWGTPPSSSCVPLEGEESCVPPLEKYSVGKYSVALLVFENTGGGGHWRQFESVDPPCDAGELKDGCVVTFGSKCKSGGTRSARVPMGRHLLLLVRSSGSIRAPYFYGAVTDKKYIFARPAFYPGADKPSVTLGVR